MNTIKNVPISENTTLGELLASMNIGERPSETLTPRQLRETAGDPIATEERCKVYANGFCVYDNGSGRTVLWLPSCTSFTYHFDSMKDSEKGGDIKESAELPEGVLESLPWPIAVTLIGDHRIERNMDNRTGSRTGTMDYDFDDNGDKDGDAEASIEKQFRKEYIWSDERYGENPEDALIRKETQQEMLECMTDKQRKVFLLYYRDGYIQREIAKMLDIDQTSVRDHIAGALKKIKNYS